ncbi:MAG: bifunctional oligoribonuclease/PAP phosphatase NrnA [Bacteroidota bacterium]
MENKIKQLKQLITDAKHIVITTHTNPDGDAMGSSLGLYHYLKNLGKKVDVITPNAVPSFLNFLPEIDAVTDFELHPKQAAKLVDKADLLFTLDFNNLKRLEKLGELFLEKQAPIVMIDHHIAPQDYAKITFSDTSACSTCQMIYEVIEALGDADKVNAAIANCLYTGIMTDTGSFKFASTTAQTHLITAKLIEAGVNKTFIHESVYDTNTESRMRLVGYSLSEKLTVIENCNTAFIALKHDELQRFHYQKGDTEGLVNYALSINGIRFAAFFVERDGQIKVSLRSKAKFDVNTFARKYYNGGGHFNAAGGQSDLNIDETILQFTDILKTYKDELNA